MKKSLKKFVQKINVNEKSKLQGGFGSFNNLRGGVLPSVNDYCHGENKYNCSNQRNCSDTTNDYGCHNYNVCLI